MHSYALAETQVYCHYCTLYHFRICHCQLLLAHSCDFFPIFLLQNKSLHLLLSLLTQVSLFSLKSILSLLSLLLYLVLKLARSNQTIKKQKSNFTIFHFALPSPIQLSFDMVHSLLSFDMSGFWLIFPISVAAGGTKCLCLSTAK